MPVKNNLHKNSLVLICIEFSQIVKQCLKVDCETVLEALEEGMIFMKNIIFDSQQ
jgi:hypothetical protein